MALVVRIGALLVLAAQATVAFTVVSSRWRNPNVHRHRRHQVVSKLPVTIYPPDYDDTSQGPASSFRIEELLAGPLGARLCAAFSPQPLELKDVDEVSIITMDEFHVDLQAIVRREDSGDCVCLFVPVPFPNPCPSAGDEECILQQLQELEMKAVHMLETRSGAIELEETKVQEGHDLSTLSNLDLPDWWAYSTELSDECKHLMKVVNVPNFEPQLLALATSASRDELMDAEKAVIVDMCPAGLILRAKVREEDSESPYRTVPAQFMTRADSLDSLREIFLQTIAGEIATKSSVDEISPDVMIEDTDLSEDDADTGIAVIDEGVDLLEKYEVVEGSESSIEVTDDSSDISVEVDMPRDSDSLIEENALDATVLFPLLLVGLIVTIVLNNMF